MRILISGLLLAFVLPISGAAQSREGNAASAQERVDAAMQSLMAHYDGETGLWKTEGWWNGANSATVVGEALALKPSKPLKREIEGTYKKAQVKFPLFRNKFYDDEGWWALAWIQAFDVTHHGAYLGMAESIFSDMAGGWDETCGGGIWWNKDRKYKNAIANELFLSVAAHLAARTKGAQRERYLEWARKEWGWFQGSGMINNESLVNDGLTAACKNNGRNPWTYNQGVVLGGLAELARVDKDAAPLREAGLIAHAAIAKLTDPDLVLHDKTEPKCSGDTVQFKGIFLRNLVELQKAAPSDEYVKFFHANADAIWTKSRTEENGFACRWSGPAEDGGAAAATSALGALIADADALESRR